MEAFGIKGGGVRRDEKYHTSATNDNPKLEPEGVGEAMQGSGPWPMNSRLF